MRNPRHSLPFIYGTRMGKGSGRCGTSPAQSIAATEFDVLSAGMPGCSMNSGPMFLGRPDLWNSPRIGSRGLDLVWTCAESSPIRISDRREFRTGRGLACGDTGPVRPNGTNYLQRLLTIDQSNGDLCSKFTGLLREMPRSDDDPGLSLFAGDDPSISRTIFTPTFRLRQCSHCTRTTSPA